MNGDEGKDLHLLKFVSAVADLQIKLDNLTLYWKTCGTS